MANGKKAAQVADGEDSGVAMARNPIVKMTDGREVVFPKTRRMLKTSAEFEGKPAVRFDFSNGDVHYFMLPTHDAALMTRLAQFGASQKLGDSVNKLTEVEDIAAAISHASKNLSVGKWGERNDSVKLFAGASVLVMAIAELTGTQLAAVKETLRNMSMAEKMSMRQGPELAPIIARITAERQARKGLRSKKKKATAINTAALLGRFKPADAVPAEATTAE